jgi:hypothetical protein
MRQGERSASRQLRARPLLALALILLAAFGATARAAAFDPADLEALLRLNPATGRPVDSIEELVPLLPPNLRSNFTLVYDSRSPFRSSITPQHPRVVLFTDDARLILTFIGAADQPGHELLEAMAYDDQTATFQLRAYLLPAGARSAWRPSPEAANCNACHGADPRPIFDSYPLWPGFYGSVLDTFFHDRLGQAELKNYRAFLAGPAKTGVYKDLIFRPGSPVTPFLDPRRIKRNVVELDIKAFPFVPDARLGMALTELNRKRIYRKLAAAPGFPSREPLLLAELLDCRGAPRPPPGAVRRIDALLVAEDAARIRRLGGRPSDPNQTIDAMEELNFERELSVIDDVARRAGADRSDWSMAMEPGSLAFYDGILGGTYHHKSYYLKEDLIYEILDHMQQRDPTWRRYFVSDLVYADEGYPFGNRAELGPALKACRRLVAARGATG